MTSFTRTTPKNSPGKNKLTMNVLRRWRDVIRCGALRGKWEYGDETHVLHVFLKRGYNMYIFNYI